MCGRYSIYKPAAEIIKYYPQTLPASWKPNYNLAPTQNGLVITADEPNIIQEMHFGLIPFHSPTPKFNYSTLNAISEEALTKNTWRPLIENWKTCIVLANNFIEWEKKDGQSLPWIFKLKDRETYSFAGLWSEWKSRDGNQKLRSFTILTVHTNEIVGRVHTSRPRMPVILDPEIEKIWLNKREDLIREKLAGEFLINFCQTYPSDNMEAFRVGTEINTAARKDPNGTFIPINHPELLQPINSF